MFEGVKIAKIIGGLGGTNPSGDAVMGLRLMVPLAPSGAAYGTVHKLVHVTDVEALGVTASYDANNEILAHYHVSEFFRLAQNAILFVQFIAEGAVATLTANLKSFVEENSLRAVFLVHNANLTFTEISGHIDAAQVIIDSMAADFVFLDSLMIEGGTDAGGYAADLRQKSGQNVSIIIGVDPVVTELTGVPLIGYASVGSVAGMLAARKVNENLGSVDILSKPSGSKGQSDYPLTKSGLNRFLSAALSDGRKVSDLTTTHKNGLTSRGYIYAGSFAGYPGFFLNGAPTCIEAASDFSYVENNRIWNKAARITRNALIPKIRSVLKKDATTGYLRTETVKALEAIAQAAMNSSMVRNDEISGYSIYIDPNQSPSETVPLIAKMQIVVDGTLHSIELQLGLTKNI